jgi:uncharacterized RDD family membrane protein YckC
MKAAVQQICSNCGNPLLPDGKFCLFCGDVLADVPEKPRAAAPSPIQPIQKPAADATVHGLPEYAGFWLRLWAGAIDVSLEASAALLLTLVVGYAFRILGSRSGLSPITGSYFTGIAYIAVLTIGAWLYSAFSESSKWRATIGKRIVGLQVVNVIGGKLTFGQASVRHFMKFLSLFTVAVGFMMAGWTRRRQALHDMPCDCLVIRVAEPSLSLLGRHS